MKPALYSILWLFLGSAALGQGTSSGVSALKIPTNALQATLGASTVSTAMSLGAVSMNPASVVTTEGTLSVLFTHTSWVEGTTGNHLSVSLPMPLGQAFLTTGMSVVPDIEVRTGPGPPSSTFSARTAQIGGGWGLEISSGILLGLSASYVYDRLYDTEATGLSGSAGVLATGLLDDATFGASVTNSGSVSGYKGTASDLPRRLTIGGTYRLAFGDLTVEPALSYQSVRNGASGIHIGAGVRYEFLTIRGSLRTGETAQSGAVGAAVFYRGISVEYALVPFTTGLGSAHIMSLGLDL